MLYISIPVTVCLCFFTHGITIYSYRILLSVHFSLSALQLFVFFKIQRLSHSTLDELKFLKTVKLHSLSVDYFILTDKLSKSKSIISHMQWAINFQGICKTSR